MRRTTSPSKQREEREKFKWNEVVRRIPYCPEPTYQFEIGQPMQIGFLENGVVKDKFFDGKLYLLEYDSHVKDFAGRDTKEVIRETNYYYWYQLRPESTNTESFIRNSDVRIHYMHTMIDSIFSKKYFFGLNMDPDYQRGYEWTLEDKQKLIDSIFNNVDIGKFAFIHKQTYGKDEPLYEVLDGKQRINAICEFYENRFPYKGKYFNDLCPRDRHHFTDYSIDFSEKGSKFESAFCLSKENEQLFSFKMGL